MKNLLIFIIFTPVIFSNQNSHCNDVELYFINPPDGLITNAREIKIEFGSKNVKVSPAGVMVDNADPCLVSGHHHLIINNAYDVTANRFDPIPYGENILHFGGGQTEATLSLKPGKYDLQLALGDYQHVPVKPVNSGSNYQPLVSKKITIEITSE